MNITFIFHKCRCSSAAMTPVKYECHSNNVTGTYVRSKILLDEQSFSNPHPRDVLSSDLLWEYRIEPDAMELPCVKFTFPTKIICRSVPDCVTDCPCGVWWRGLITCPLYVGLFLGKVILSELVYKFDIVKTRFFIMYAHMWGIYAYIITVTS